MANPFAIEPANALQALMTGVQGYDAGAKRTKEAEMMAGRQEAMTALQSGGDLRSPLAKLIGIGDVQGAKAIADFSESQETRAFRETEAKRAQFNADRSHGLQTQQLTATLEGAKVPSGFQRGPSGALAPVSGGPADPTYIGAVADQKAKPREFSLSDITKLTEEGGKFSNITGFSTTFEPRFAGYKSEAIGNAATWAGRNVPSMVPKDTADAAQWWQGYDRFKNVVRNDLFGSALTATEKAAFERADINAGMDPQTIKANLERQHEIAMNGLKRKANALIQAGYDPKAISAAYGLRLEDIGVAATGRKSGSLDKPADVTVGPAPKPKADQSRVPPKIGTVVDGYRFKGGDPADRESWIKLDLK